MKKPNPCARAVAALLACSLTACVGTLVETTTDAALAVAKVPFKAGGAIVDIVSAEPDDD
jgi:hypothetical protein